MKPLVPFPAALAAGTLPLCRRPTFQPVSRMDLRMHELSAATAIVRTVVKASEGRNVRRIMAIRIQIGDLTLLNPEQLEFCLEIAAKDTIAEGAKLDVERSPAFLECQDCGSRFEWTSLRDDPAYHLIPPKLGCDCGSTRIKIASGRELKVLDMTVESESS